MRRHRLTALLASAALVPRGRGGRHSQRRGLAARRRAGGAVRRRTRPTSGGPGTASRTSPPTTSAALGFGSGYAAAETSICTLADTVLTARAERSRWFGPNGRYNDQVTLDASNLQVDAFVTDLRNRRVVEKLLADPQRGPGRQARAIVRGYVAGVNEYLDEVGPNGVTDPKCRGAAYLKQKARPIDLWYGVYLANLLASSGVFVKEIVDADPPAPDDPGIPNPTASSVDRDELLEGLGRGAGLRLRLQRDRDRRRRDHDRQGHGARQPALPVARPLQLHPAAPDDPRQVRRGRRLADRLAGRQHRLEQQRGLEPHRVDGLPLHAVRVPARQPGHAHDLPHRQRSAGAGAPRGRGDRQAPGRLAGDGQRGPLPDPRGLRRSTRRRCSCRGRSAACGRSATSTPSTCAPSTCSSRWPRRANVRDLLRRQDEAAGMPWVNTTAADRDGNALYADHSVVPHVTQEMEDQCKTPTGEVLDQLAGLPGLDGTRAGSSCKWGTDEDASRSGVFGPSNLPDTIRRDWVANANDSYWLPNPAEKLEGFASIIGCERCERTMRTRMVYRYVQDRLAGTDGLAAHRKESPWTLRHHEHANRLGAFEVMSANDDLYSVCDATGETRACEVLRAWDGRSERDSRGTHIFEEFVARLPAAGVWETPFDPDDPLNTPRDLATPQPARDQGDAGRDRLAAAAGDPVRRPLGLAPGGRRPWRPADRARRRDRRLGRQRQRPRLALGGGQQRPLPPDHLRLLAHPGDRVPPRRPGQHPHDPDLRPVGEPALAVVDRPDAAVRRGRVGALPVDRHPDPVRPDRPVRRLRRADRVRRSPQRAIGPASGPPERGRR